MGLNRPPDPSADRAAGASRAPHADRVLQAAESAAAAAASPVAASWSRSVRLHGLSPDDTRRRGPVESPRLKEAGERIGAMGAVAADVMDRLFAAVGETGACVIFSDAGGLILDRRGAPGDDDDFARWGLWTGNDWSEGAEGTNGVGTCAIEERPVIVMREEHFHSRNIAMSCMGAPVFDHRGRLAAVLDVSSCRRDLTHGLAKLTAHAVADAARRIETESFQTASPGCRIVVAEGHGEGGAMLLAVDRDDLLVGATRRARRSLGLDDESFRSPRPLSDVLGERAEAGDFDSAERAEIRRALARAGGNASAAARGLGVSRATLYRRMARLGLDRSAARPAAAE